MLGVGAIDGALDVIGSARAEVFAVAVSAARAVESVMVAAANMVEVAALVGDTARATMLGGLMCGQSLTGGELAFLAHVSPSTASEHLAKLVAARLLAVTRRRRFNYYRIASPLVAQMLESMKVVAALEVPPRYQPRSMRDDAMRFARTCYDHLAGMAAVAIADALVERDYVALSDDGGEVTPAGARFLGDFGADLSAQSRGRRIFCRPCLDWSERRYHIAGHVGTEICRCCLQRGWFVRERDSRALRLTPAGAAGLHASFDLNLGGAQPGKSEARSGKPAKLVSVA